MSNIKQIILSNTKNEKRKIVNSESWEKNIQNINYERQIEILRNIGSEENNMEVEKIIKNNILTKIRGYKNQDQKKKILDKDNIVELNDVVELLNTSKFCCYYCKKQTSIFYENVKDETQWTLDRLDNKYGHNKGNVVISCLSCNLKRKTMHFKRFEFTKQLQIIKNEHEQSDIK